MKNEFVKETYGAEADSEPIVVQLSRSQIKQMAEMAEHFSEIGNFELHIEGDQKSLRFVLGLDNDSKGKTK
jgi:hypothetical protein